MYTDLDSKIAQYTKVMNFFKVFLPIEFIGFIIEISGAIKLNSYLLATFAVLLGMISLAMFNVIWKCRCKIKEYEQEKNI